MKLTTILKTAAFATATMFFLGCTETAKESEAAQGVIHYAAIGEDIPYHDLEFTGNLSHATITYAYMLVKDPTLMPENATTATTGAPLNGVWAVDLMAKDEARTPVTLGYVDAAAGSYESHPKISLPANTALATAVDKGGLAQLTEKNVSFLFGGVLKCADGVAYKYEIQEPLEDLTIDIEEYPATTNHEAGKKLFVPENDTLLASFHPHIDHALEVLDENPIVIADLQTKGDTIVINNVMNATVNDALNKEVKLYDDIVGHINRGDHWDVNVIPGAEEPEVIDSSKGIIHFATLGEDIPYDNLEFTGNLSHATIKYAYMMVKNPTLMPSHASRHAGELFEGVWAVDLMAKDADRTPVTLGYMASDTGMYEDLPKITIPAASALASATDLGGLAKLKEKNVSFLFGGTFKDADGNEFTYEIQEPLPNITIPITEFPTATNGEAGTKLYVPSADTLLASFHPHIDHALEVLDENPIDYTSLATVGDTIVINDVTNAVVKDMLGNDISLYLDMVKHINRGDHWDVNVIPGE